jgi:phenylacetate-coenzyme A ligase PaaK-like adenylate-forming protein
MTKQDIRDQFPHGLVADDVNIKSGIEKGDLFFAATSGTTGERLQVLSDTRIGALPDGYAQLWKLTDWPEERIPRTAVFTSPVCSGAICHLGRASMQERTRADNTLFLNSTEDPFRMEEDLVCNLLEEIDRFKPDFLFSHPVFLALLAQKVAGLGQRFPSFQLVLCNYQFFSKCQRRILSQYLDCPIYNWLLATELGGSHAAVQCSEGNVHLRMDHLYPEILWNGERCEANEMGHLVVTTHNPTLPLVRYITGDLATIKGIPCGCTVGSYWPTIELDGRAADLLCVAGRPVSTRMVDDVLAKFEGIDFYRLVQASESEIALDVVPSQLHRLDKKQVADDLEDIFPRHAIRVAEQATLPLEASLKLRLTQPILRDPKSTPGWTSASPRQ